MARYVAVVAWLAAGHAVAGGLYWTLLQIPESNVAMLAASVAVIVAAVAWCAIVETGALTAWAASGVSSLAGRTIRRSAWFLPALALFLLLWWLGSTAGEWYGSYATQIDAWLLLHAGWAKTGGLHRAIGWLWWFVSWGIGVSLGLSLLAHAVRNGGAALVHPAWLRQAFAWRQLLLVLVMLLLGFRLPWSAVYWRPKGVPPTWLEPAFVAVKLGVLYLCANVAWAILLRTVARAAGSSDSR